MAEIGQLGALDYRLSFPPQTQTQMGGGVPALQQPQVELPAYENDPLAVREKLTSDYYGSMGLIRSFAKDMVAKGIDPFKPDYSQDGGGLAFQTMQKLQANLMYSANALQNEFKREAQVNDAVLRGDARVRSDFDPQSQMFIQNPDAAYSTRLDPRTVAANQRTAQNVYTQGDAANVNRNVYDPTKQALQGSYSGEQLEYQQSGLLPSVAETSYQQLIPRGGSGRSASTEVEVLKKVTNLAQGAWPEGTFNVTTRGGRPLLENKTFAGENLGEYQGVDAKGNPKVYKKIVKRWLKDPQTGEVTVEFEDRNIPNELVSNATGDVYASALITNNPKYGSASKMYETAREMGLLDDTSSARNEALVSQGALSQAGQEAAQAGAGTVTEAYSRVKGELKSLSNPSFLGINTGNNWNVYKSPDGREIQIAKHKNGSHFFIKNWEDLGYDKQPENLTLDGVLNLLDDDFNYFSKFLGKPKAQQQSQPSAKSIKASDIPLKAQAAGYTPEEYTQLLQQRGIQIVN